MGNNFFIVLIMFLYVYLYMFISHNIIIPYFYLPYFHISNNNKYSCNLLLHRRSCRALYSLLWRHNGWDSVSNHQPYDCLINRLFRRRSKITPKLCVTGLCVGNSPETGEFPAQKASKAENVFIWLRHHVMERVRWTKYDVTLIYIKRLCWGHPPLNILLP